MTYEEALEKVRKLLRLSASNNANEAALAAARAQEIMDRYKIEQATLSLDGASQPDEPIKDFRDDPLVRGERKSYWKQRLASCIAKVNGCRIYLFGGNISIVGQPSNVSGVRYLFAWLEREVNRLADRDCRGNGRTYTNNYRIGVVETIKERLQEQAKATKQAVIKEIEDSQLSTEGRDLALVRLNQAVLKVEAQGNTTEIWMRSHLRLSRGSVGSFAVHDNARAAGRLAGKEIRLRPARGHLT